MDKLKQYFEQSPALSTALITSFCVGLLLLAKIFETDPAPLFNLPRLCLLGSINFFVIYFLKHAKWDVASGLTNRFSNWHSRWWLATAPLIIIAFLSLTSVNWHGLTLSYEAIFAWLLTNVATGLFEEVLMRGLCFYVLLKAWGKSKYGVYKAAFFQALIFGLAHLGNLYHMPTLDVIAQVTFATLIGIGFAGLVLLTKSLWPAIIVHTLINAAGTINTFFVLSDVEFQSPGIDVYLVIIALFFVFSTLPGLLYLKAATPRILKKQGV